MQTSDLQFVLGRSWVNAQLTSSTDILIAEYLLKDHPSKIKFYLSQYGIIHTIE